MSKHRPLTKAELLARMPRAFRPKLDAGQVRDLGLLHVVNVDAIARGEATVQLMWDWVGAVMTWSRAAELLGQGEPEMQEQLELTYRVLQRYARTGRIAFDGPDYQAAKRGQMVMDLLAEQIDRPTAERAANWGEAKMLEIRAMTTPERTAA